MRLPLRRLLDRRLSHRHSVSWSARIAVAGLAPWEVRVIDISREGVKLDSTEYIKPGTALDLVLNLNDDDSLAVTLKAKVVSSRLHPEDQHFHLGLALEEAAARNLPLLHQQMSLLTAAMSA